MHPSPPIGQFPRYPITTLVAALAIVASVQSSFGQHINPNFLGITGDCLREPWRLVTSSLFHGDPLHLIFNLFWLWIFGTLVEERFGHGATLALYVLLAAGPDAAELAFSHNCIGLSGVNYGLFGMLWVLSSRDARFRGAVDRQTVQLMVVWFFLCIVLTMMDIWRVGNIAHGVGCLLGACLGWTISARSTAARLGRGAIMVAVSLAFLASGVIVQHRYFLHRMGIDLAYRGYQALEKDDNQEAVTLYEKAVAIDQREYGWWYNLGIAYHNLGRNTEAAEAFGRARALKPKGRDSE
jgi:membrane associated rhomboid family serine protease